MLLDLTYVHVTLERLFKFLSMAIALIEVTLSENLIGADQARPGI
jgi:hypothetical protein